MNTDQLSKNLDRLFHTEGHRIVFWNDPDQEFLDTFPMTMDELNEDLTSYLIPVYDITEQAINFILKNSKRILEVECSGCDASGKYWPKTLNKKLLWSSFSRLPVARRVFLPENVRPTRHASCLRIDATRRKPGHGIAACMDCERIMPDTGEWFFQYMVKRMTGESGRGGVGGRAKARRPWTASPSMFM